MKLSGKVFKTMLVMLAAGLLVFLFFYTRTAADTANQYFQVGRVSVYSKLSFIGNFISQIRTIRTLTEENIKLQEENLEFTSRLAFQSGLREENEFLRDSLGLEHINDAKLSEVGVFNFQFTPRGHTLLINKGGKDGIGKSNVVLSSAGVLIGTVDEVFDSYARVATVTDSDFKATVGILFKNISGIANGAMGDGVYLDFISQNDDIAEGDVVVTAGNDIFPPGLLIGKVVQISSDSGSLFKNVKVKPMIQELDLSRALVIIK